MDPITAGSTAYESITWLLRALNAIHPKNDPTVEDLKRGARKVYDRRRVAISEHVKDALVQSTVYIDQTIFDDPALLGHLINTIHQLYGGYVLTALGLSQMVGECRVRDMLRKVATEAYVDHVELAEKCMERYLDHTVTRVSVEASPSVVIDPEPAGIRSAAGKTLQLTLGVGDESVQAYVHIQLLPVMLHRSVAQQLIAMNFGDTLKQRLRKWRAGEIRFVADFLFAQHELERLDKALRKDKSNVLAQALSRRNNAIRKSWFQLASGKGTSNLATTVLIIDKNNFNEACANANLNFKQAGDRANFFQRSMMLMVVVVDQEYSLVDIYTHGLSQYGTYTFSAIEKVGGSNASMDMKSLLALLAQGQAAKF